MSTTRICTRMRCAAAQSCGMRRKSVQCVRCPSVYFRFWCHSRVTASPRDAHDCTCMLYYIMAWCMTCVYIICIYIYICAPTVAISGFVVLVGRVLCAQGHVRHSHADSRPPHTEVNINLSVACAVLVLTRYTIQTMSSNKRNIEKTQRNTALPQREIPGGIVIGLSIVISHHLYAFMRAHDLQPSSLRMCHSLVWRCE